MKDLINFRTTQDPLTEAQIAQNVALLDLPPNWTRAHDVALVEGIFTYPGLFNVAVRMRRPLDDVQPRFLQLRRAATDDKRDFGLVAQSRLLRAVRMAAETVTA